MESSGGNILNQLDVGMSSKFYSTSEEEEDSESESLNIESENSRSANSKRYGEKQQYPNLPDKANGMPKERMRKSISRKSRASKQTKKSNCKSERWNSIPKSQKPKFRPVENEFLDTSQMNLTNSIPCNVTELGERKKIVSANKKNRALKQGDKLIKKSEEDSQCDDSKVQKQKNKTIKHTNELVEQTRQKNRKKTHSKRVTKSNTGQLNELDQVSVDSKKQKYSKLSINVKQANDVIKNLLSEIAIPTNNSNSNSRQPSQQTTPSPQIVNGVWQASTMPRQSVLSQKSHQGPVMPMGSPLLTQNTILKGNQKGKVQAEINQAQEQLQLERYLQEQAVSPFHKSQVSYSDYKQYKNYFNLDNKDQYFSSEQIPYYIYQYPQTLPKTHKPLPIEKWTLGKMIGHGSFGNVYEGMDQQHGRQIAVKQVPITMIGPNQGTQQRKLRALKQEIKLLNSLQHHNIVKYLGTHEDKEHLNVFLEYVAQGSLEHHYKNFPLNESLVANYTQQILLGLEYLHYNNIVHRDIKAANILIRDDGTCTLADFGSSKKIIETQKTDTKSFCGTPYWMAPEVVKQTGHNRFADIWSLGCTVYEMMANEPPWQDNNNQLFKVLNKIASTTKPPKYPQGISPGLTDFLDCCFQSQPNKRSNVYELLHHPFITRKEFTVPQAGQLRILQTINEQQSNSDMSPFSQSQPKHAFNYKNIDSEKLKRGQIKPTFSYNNLLQAQGQDQQLNNKLPFNAYEHDVSPYSIQSSKTQGNVGMKRMVNNTLDNIHDRNSSSNKNVSMLEIDKKLNAESSKNTGSNKNKRNSGKMQQFHSKNSKSSGQSWRIENTQLQQQVNSNSQGQLSQQLNHSGSRNSSQQTPGKQIGQPTQQLFSNVAQNLVSPQINNSHVSVNSAYRDEESKMSREQQSQNSTTGGPVTNKMRPSNVMNNISRTNSASNQQRQNSLQFSISQQAAAPALIQTPTNSQHNGNHNNLHSSIVSNVGRPETGDSEHEDNNAKRSLNLESVRGQTSTAQPSLSFAEDTIQEVEDRKQQQEQHNGRSNIIKRHTDEYSGQSATLQEEEIKMDDYMSRQQQQQRAEQVVSPSKKRKDNIQMMNIEEEKQQQTNQPADQSFVFEGEISNNNRGPVIEESTINKFQLKPEGAFQSPQLQQVQIMLDVGLSPIEPQKMGFDKLINKQGSLNYQNKKVLVNEGSSESQNRRSTLHSNQRSNTMRSQDMIRAQIEVQELSDDHSQMTFNLKGGGGGGAKSVNSSILSEHSFRTGKFNKEQPSGEQQSQLLSPNIKHNEILLKQGPGQAKDSINNKQQPQQQQQIRLKGATNFYPQQNNESDIVQDDNNNQQQQQIQNNKQSNNRSSRLQLSAEDILFREKQNEFLRPKMSKSSTNVQQKLSSAVPEDKSPMSQLHVPKLDNTISDARNSQAAAQVSKFSLDNNLTDIEEDDNENRSQLEQWSQKGSQTSVLVNKDHPKFPIDKASEIILQLKQVAQQTKPLLNLKNQYQNIQQPQQVPIINNLLLTESYEQSFGDPYGEQSNPDPGEGGGFSPMHVPLSIPEEPENEHMSAAQQYSVDESNRTSSESSSSSNTQSQNIQANGSSQKSGFKKDPNEQKSKRMKIEDLIAKEIAKAEAAKKQQTFKNTNKQISSAPIFASGANNRMVKARKLMIPKIFVADSNFSPAQVLNQQNNNFAAAINNAKGTNKSSEANIAAIDKNKQQPNSNSKSGAAVVFKTEQYASSAQSNRSNFSNTQPQSNSYYAFASNHHQQQPKPTMKVNSNNNTSSAKASNHMHEESKVYNNISQSLGIQQELLRSPQRKRSQSLSQYVSKLESDNNLKVDTPPYTQQLEQYQQQEQVLQQEEPVPDLLESIDIQALQSQINGSKQQALVPVLAQASDSGVQSELEDDSSDNDDSSSYKTPEVDSEELFEIEDSKAPSTKLSGRQFSSNGQQQFERPPQ